MPLAIVYQTKKEHERYGEEFRKRVSAKLRSVVLFV